MFIKLLKKGTIILSFFSFLVGTSPVYASSSKTTADYSEAITQAHRTYKEKGYVWSKYMQLYRTDWDYLNMSLRNFESNRIYKDANGIPMVQYYGKHEYNPVTTAQWALAAHGRYVRSKKESDLKEFISLSDGLLNMQGSDGAFRYQFTFKKPELDTVFKPGWTSAMSQGQALSVFSRAYSLTGNTKYLIAGQLSLNYLMTPKQKGGVLTDLSDISVNYKNYLFFEEYVTEKDNYTLNGFMFTLFGLYDWSQLQTDRQYGQVIASESFRKGIQSLKLLLRKYDIGGFSTYDLSHLTMKKPPHIVPLYHSVHIYQLHALWTITHDQYLKNYSNKWTSYVENAAVPDSAASGNPEGKVNETINQFKKAYYAYSHYASNHKQLIPETEIHKEYNRAKIYYQSAVNELNKTNPANKAALRTKLDDQYQIFITQRVIPYIDAYTYAEKRLKPKVDALETAIAAGDLDQTEALYHEVSRELKAGTAILHSFYGADARNLLLSQYKTPAQHIHSILQKPVTVKMLLDQVQTLSDQGSIDQARETIIKGDSLIKDIMPENKFNSKLLIEAEKLRNTLQ